MGIKAVALTLAGLFFVSAAHAQYVGPTASPTNIRALLADGKDDMVVSLQGKIVQHLGGDKYRFSDGTGQITVEIDSKHWPSNMPVDDKTEVRLQGEYDKDLVGDPEIDVNKLEKL